MTALAFNNTAYGQTGFDLKVPRSQEYDVIARITARLKAAHAALPTGFPALAAALAENRKLWIEFATDVSLPENALPMPLKVQILNLAEFTLHHTAQVLAGTATPDVLIDINLAVMKGLSGKGGAE